MKDYRRPVDYHNKDYRKVSYGRFPGHPPTAPVYNPHATWVNCNKVKNVGGRGSFSLDPRPH